MRKLVYKVLLGVNILLASALLLSYLAVHVSPGRFALPALFGLAYPYLLLMNIMLAMTWAVLLRPEALISVAVIIAGANHLSNFIRIDNHDKSTEGAFKVMSYNVRLFNVYESQSSGSERMIIAFLKEAQPDIICLQEFYIKGDPKEKDRRLRSALGGEFESHMKMTAMRSNSYYGNVTYSRFPIVNRGQVIHPNSSGLTIFTDVLIENDTFRIFNNHLQSFRLRSMERSFVEEMAGSSDNEALETMKSLSVSLRRAFIRRAGQADVVKSQIDRSPYPVIIAGDFNDTPVSYTYRRMRGDFMDAFVSTGYGAGFTYRGYYPANRIDYILYDDKTLESRNFEIIKVKYSDHYPVSGWFSKRN
ncbi:MAG TPA: endonuclease/exonuclease/phosphatase family protein [Bacteroidales bacterium]|nr:endonuclease/exonuclease/phosphatase family protein [Bacteroidales bacterium]HPF02638.1 endonuclease/exonuclease/phosphatase family protein [Bacteroidales bacterium]HPJ59096.1 endonuclease/exonuclease/phosphatase family protein [Bacteroidales bacterium]HPR11395.1 endonuclease/exonuclease/phosphatase family protein [Bacteroidales bacterium]HRW85654.1 endonuclease/exonuclease/phosphatase family protein [Bacteroidales bacterium]